MKKPVYFNAVIIIIEHLISFILTIVEWNKLSENLKLNEIIITIFAIYIMSIIISLLIYTPFYAFFLYRYCKSIEKDNNTLQEKLQMQIKEYKKLDILKSQLSLMIEQITGNMRDELCLEKDNFALQKVYDNAVNKKQNFELYKK